MKKELSKVIEPERLILRRFAMSDFDDLYEYISDPVVTEFEPYKPMNEEETKENPRARSAKLRVGMRI